MPRIARMIVKGEPAVYHVISRTALKGFVLENHDKDYLVNLIRWLSKVYFTEVLGFCIMGNHFHLLVKMLVQEDFPDEEIQGRYKLYYGNNKKKKPELSPGQIPFYRNKWSNLSEYVREIKQGFSRYYNRTYKRKGFFWSERFKSVIVDKGETLINCLAYIDLNPVRAKMVKKPEEYRWNSMGYHVQARNKEGFLSLDFGLKEFGYECSPKKTAGYIHQKIHQGRILKGKTNITTSPSTGVPSKSKKQKDSHSNVQMLRERFRYYRKYVYEKAGISKGKEKEEYDLSVIDRFKYRTRYFSDSGIIGTREFVVRIYQEFKDYFQSRREKQPRAIRGLEGVYSLKRLSETI